MPENIYQTDDKKDKPLLFTMTIIAWLGIFAFAYLAGGAGDNTGINWLKSNIDFLKIPMFITIMGASAYDILSGIKTK
jgi:hypothetical protein